MQLSRIAILAAAAVVAGLLTNTAAARADVLADEVVAEHNRARARYGAEPLAWDAELAADAAAFAQLCEFDHRGLNGKSQGENLFVGSDPNTGIKQAVSAWMGEVVKYDFDHPDFSRETGHFTQVVWKSTTRVGAGIADCPAGKIMSMPTRIVVVRYAPPGNIQGQFAENVGRPQS
ncbi:hypothetical protein D5S18_20140 [Nocardia panacis]|uniref:SCP domain-containing protein n=1 Tax=Nocardia panacis TaxID=2340916 RepID=A0A3A4K1C3_9NOCA|nr:CAP family protein [Nocardia panacis]RJO73520.1 hypothetical protein D5S18_20140 [Nocardia panacis]